MVATPQYGQMIFLGAKTKQTYPVDIYVSDVNAALVRFDNGAGASATSETFITFNEPVVLKDYSMVTGTADTEKLRLLANNTPTNMVLRYVPHLTTNSNRPPLNIGFGQGTRISAFQISD
jgi:hypothetical protein